MRKFYSTVCLMQTRLATALCSLIILLSLGVNAQNRPFGIIYSENLRGGSALFGNTLLHAVNPNGTVNLTAMNGNSTNGNSAYDNGGATSMQNVDIDGSTGFGAGTRNSSSADLVLPSGTNTVKLARLYWGGRALSSEFNMAHALNRTIKIRKGTTGAYQELAANQLDRTVENAGTATEFSLYQAFTDITTLVQQQGAGTYTVGNGAFSTGIGGDFGNYGAWSIVVVYENTALNFNSVRVYDGYQQIYNGGGATSSTINLSGLNVPSGALSLQDAQIGIMGWEGDARYNGDFFKINNNLFSNTLNTSNNSWNGTISNNGVHVTAKNPNYTDQMGIDIDQFNVGTGYGILPNATNVSLEFGTTQDQYFSGIITFVIRMKDPIIELAKKVTDANNSSTAEIGEILTYKLKGKNIGAGNANAVIVTDSIPSSMTYVSNSLKVNYGPGIAAGLKTDAAGDDIAEYNAAKKTVTFRIGNNANTVNGGYLALADSFEVEFNVTVNMPVSGIAPPLINVARMRAKSDALVDYVDDATAVLSPAGGPLPVTLTSFTASLQPNNLVNLTWTTSLEINCKRYDIQRSNDGVDFKTVATKAGSGNSSVSLSYVINDDVNAVFTPIVYYRLSQVDLDGKQSISKVVSVKLKKTASSFIVTPNPFSNNVNINIEWDKIENTVVKVFSATGSEVATKTVKMNKGNNYIVIDELSTVQPGNYIIQFNSANGKLIKQIVKQN